MVIEFANAKLGLDLTIKNFEEKRLLVKETAEYAEIYYDGKLLVEGDKMSCLKLAAEIKNYGSIPYGRKVITADRFN